MQSLSSWTQAPTSYLVKALNNPKDSPNVAQVWLYQAFQNFLSSMEVIDTLVGQGYKHIGTELLWFLSSQLHDTASVISPEKQRSELWAKESALEFIKQYPVILGSEMEMPEFMLRDARRVASIPTIPMVNPLPLKQMGQVAFIIDINDIHAPVLGGYRISELPQEAPRRSHSSIVTVLSCRER